VAAREPGVVAIGAGRAGRPPAEAIDSPEERLYSLSRRYLGGTKFSDHPVNSRSEVHSAIVGGVSYGALIHLISQVKGVLEADIAKVLGISARTLRRQSESPEKEMPADLASKAWLFAETLAKATDVFGGKEQAEAWMSKAAMGLDGQRPIDLLQTIQGAEVVNDFLTRLEYGVYS
jgi:putative toxin-antitoxin system antitoxin component (TIGR02293 family)